MPSGAACRPPGCTPPSTIRIDQPVRSFQQSPWKTGCTSDGELAITLRMSAVAVCCSSASIAVFISLNSRTFSIAITAWSAKVCSSAICLSLNGRISVRRSSDNPDRLALAQHRHRQHGANTGVGVWECRQSPRCPGNPLPSSDSVSRRCTGLPSTKARPAVQSAGDRPFLEINIDRAVMRAESAGHCPPSGARRHRWPRKARTRSRRWHLAPAARQSVRRR